MEVEVAVRRHLLLAFAGTSHDTQLQALLRYQTLTRCPSLCNQREVPRLLEEHTCDSFAAMHQQCISLQSNHAGVGLLEKLELAKRGAMEINASHLLCRH